MSVTILLFGRTAEVVGQHRIERSAGAQTEVNDIVNSLRNDFPGLNSCQLIYALNETYVSGEKEVTDGDEIAIFTPVSGG
jgi:molybdopterin converting factor small subunit